MGTNTPLKSLYKPTVGETGWGASVNSNFDKLDHPKFTVLWGNDTVNNLTNHVDNYHSYTVEVLDDLNIWSGATSTLTTTESGLYRIRADCWAILAYGTQTEISKGKFVVSIEIDGVMPAGAVDNLYGPPNDITSTNVAISDEITQMIDAGKNIRVVMLPDVTFSGGSGEEMAAVSYLMIEKIR
jgi:hypothetical protein